MSTQPECEIRIDSIDLGAAARDLDKLARNSEELLVLRAARDRNAFGELYRAHYRAIGGYLYRRTGGDVHATEDLLSDVFLAALKSIHRYRARGVPFRYWLLRIATNAANRWVKRRRRTIGTLPLQEADRLASGSENGRATGTQDVQTGAALRAVWSLSPKLQAVVTLHYMEDLGIAEIARVLGCRPGTVKSRLARARARLQTMLQQRR